MDEEAGLGDVRIAPVPGRPGLLLLGLSSPEGDAIIEMQAEGLALFLEQTYAMVPAGAEVVDVDAALTAILA